MAKSQDLTRRLENCYTGAVYDTLRHMGITDRQLPQTIRPLDATWKLAGPVYTVSGHRDETLDHAQTLLAWTELLSRAPSGHVLVCQPNDSTVAHMGELSAETLQLRGIRGYFVDGGCRDTDFVLSMGFRTWCRYTTPADVVGRWITDSLGETVRVGDVDIRTGDYLLADRDGVVIIPTEIAHEVADRTEQLINTEDLVRKAIRQGVDPQKAYLTYGVF